MGYFGSQYWLTHGEFIFCPLKVHCFQSCISKKYYIVHRLVKIKGIIAKVFWRTATRLVDEPQIASPKVEGAFPMLAAVILENNFWVSCKLLNVQSKSKASSLKCNKLFFKYLIQNANNVFKTSML